MTTYLSTRIGDQIASHELFGDLEPHWCVEVSSEDVRDVSVVWTEDIGWHAHYLEELIDNGPHGEDCEVRSNVPEVLQAELRRVLENEYVDVRWQGDDDLVTIEVPFTLEPATMDRLAELAWPVVATLTNVMDPGTFGAEYVMGTVARKVGE